MSRSNDVYRAEFSSSVLKGLEFQKIPGDDHCFFRAVALYLAMDVKEVRQIVADGLIQHFDWAREFTTYDEKDFSEYIENIRNGNEWGDNLAIFWVQQFEKRPLIIIRSDSDPIMPNDEELRTLYTGEPIFLYYNARDHYDVFFVREGYDGRQILADIQAAVARLEEVRCVISRREIRNAATRDLVDNVPENMMSRRDESRITIPAYDPDFSLTVSRVVDELLGRVQSRGERQAIALMGSKIEKPTHYAQRALLSSWTPSVFAFFTWLGFLLNGQLNNWANNDFHLPSDSDPLTGTDFTLHVIGLSVIVGVPAWLVYYSLFRLIDMSLCEPYYENDDNFIDYFAMLNDKFSRLKQLDHPLIKVLHQRLPEDPRNEAAMKLWQEFITSHTDVIDKLLIRKKYQGKHYDHKQPHWHTVARVLHAFEKNFLHEALPEKYARILEEDTAPVTPMMIREVTDTSPAASVSSSSWDNALQAIPSAATKFLSQDDKNESLAEEKEEIEEASASLGQDISQAVTATNNIVSTDLRRLQRFQEAAGQNEEQALIVMQQAVETKDANAVVAAAAIQGFTKKADAQRFGAKHVPTPFVGAVGVQQLRRAADSEPDIVAGPSFSRQSTFWPSPPPPISPPGRKNSQEERIYEQPARYKIISDPLDLPLYGDADKNVWLYIKQNDHYSLKSFNINQVDDNNIRSQIRVHVNNDEGQLALLPYRGNASAYISYYTRSRIDDAAQPVNAFKTVLLAQINSVDLSSINPTELKSLAINLTLLLKNDLDGYVDPKYFLSEDKLNTATFKKLSPTHQARLIYILLCGSEGAKLTAVSLVSSLQLVAKNKTKFDKKFMNLIQSFPITDSLARVCLQKMNVSPQIRPVARQIKQNRYTFLAGGAINRDESDTESATERTRLLSGRNRAGSQGKPVSVGRGSVRYKTPSRSGLDTDASSSEHEYEYVEEGDRERTRRTPMDSVSF